MRLLIQRVKQASVQVNEKVCGAIEEGLLIFMGVHKEDTPEKTTWLAKKVINLRLFRDDQGKMNRNIQEINGNVLIISQFTLYGDDALISDWRLSPSPHVCFTKNSSLRLAKKWDILCKPGSLAHLWKSL